MTINSIADLFLNYNKAPLPALPSEEERDLIARAYDRDDKAQMRLLEQYAPALRNAFARIVQPLRNSLSREDIEDLQMEAVMGFYAAIDVTATDPLARGLGRHLSAQVALALRDHQAVRIAVTVPARTLRRYNSIMMKADNNLNAALEIAREYDMQPSTVLAVHTAVNQSAHVVVNAAGADGAGATTEHVGALQPAVEDVVETIRLAQQARDAIDGRELEVIDKMYGFDELDQARSTREVAGLTGLSKSTVQRTHEAALSTMRSAIGLA